MRKTGITEEKTKQSNMLKVCGLTISYSFMRAFILPSIVVHQMGALGMIADYHSLAKHSYTAFLADYGDAFRTNMEPYTVSLLKCILNFR